VKPLAQLDVWFVAGSQDLYGATVLQQVDEHARRVAEALDAADAIPVRVVPRPVSRSPESIRALCLEANASAPSSGSRPRASRTSSAPRGGGTAAAGRAARFTRPTTERSAVDSSG